MEMLPPEQEPPEVRQMATEKGVLGMLDRGVVRASRYLLYIGGAGLIGMLLLMVGDVVGNQVLSRPGAWRDGIVSSSLAWWR